ncbi:hypothetical protein QAD02_014585 [Eretmocerus hayati]|uniref:Uncharacterized protein n=1 Tax=Eretmocerus hayati TaxID=131215 RepID=A0ACC2P6R7_9HYME|nr:hypothetical protein QAD02_014585 [Eretmocerus hayati]
MSFETEKQKYLSMTVEEKRKILKTEPTTVKQILTWPEYWKKNKSSIGVLKGDDPEKVDENLASKVSIWEGDITKLEIDAIVNAANSRLLGGGGVDGAIHRAAGSYLKQECATLGEKPEKLQECYRNSLSVAKQNGARTIAFPCISTGIYGYPQRAAAKVALATVKQFLVNNPDSIDRVIFCLFLKTDKDIYEELLQKYFAFE